MSADLFLQLLINLQMYGLLCPATTEQCKERMVAGLLLGQTKKEAHDMLEEFDANRDGVFDTDEIKQMSLKVNRGTIERLNATEEKAERLLTKAKEKHAAAEALNKDGLEEDDVKPGGKVDAKGHSARRSGINARARADGALSGTRAAPCPGSPSRRGACTAAAAARGPR